jgi:Flp pilus assembly protein TadG
VSGSEDAYIWARVRATWGMETFRHGLRAPMKRLAALSARRGELCQREEGQATLEFVISITTVMLLTFGLFELSMFAYTYSVLNEAAHEGVRYAIVHGTDSNACSGPNSSCSDASPYANVQAVVITAASASLHDMTAMTVAVNYPETGGAKPGSLVTVAVTYTYVPYVNLPGLATTTTLTSKGRIFY